MRKLIGLVALAMVAVLAYETLDVSDADARKRRRPAPPPPPNYTFVLCLANQQPCTGTPSADLMVGAGGREDLTGAAGNDIYVDSVGDGDIYSDESTSSDLYGGFVNMQFGDENIFDQGGRDRVDLSTSTSAYASTDFEFFRRALDGDGVQNDLHINEKDLPGLDGDDNIYIFEYFGTGRIEYIKFTDKTLTPADITNLAT